MGMKYWAGCAEDHLSRFFAGIEDYPDGGVVRTFTRNGLRLMRKCGVADYHFYYPYPDYNLLPDTIYSDRRLPKVGELSKNPTGISMRTECFDYASMRKMPLIW